MDFLSKLDSSNCIKREETGEIILTTPVFETEENLKIENPGKFSSNCQTIIRCPKLAIMSTKSVSFDNVKFEAVVFVEDSEDIEFSHCTFEKAESGLGALTFCNTTKSKLSHVEVTNIESIPGVYLTTKSEVTAHNLSIHDLPESLLVCNSESKIYLSDSNLNRTKANGIYSSGKSYVEITNCSITDTEYPAIFFSGSTGKIINNKFKNILQNGISLNSVEDASVIGNEITKVSGSAISFLDGSTGRAIQNKIEKIEGNGIYVNGGSEAEIRDNEISQNDYPGIAVLMKSKATLTNNKVSSITYSGICVRGAIDVKICDTHVNDVKECGISISDTEKCVVENCTIENCNIAACEAYNGSKVVFKNNKVSNTKESALLVYTSASMIAENNDISKIGNSMVKLLYKGGGEFVDNKVTNCPSQLDTHTTNQYFFARNGNFRGITNVSSKVSDQIDLDKPFVDINTMCIKCKERPRDCFLFDCGHKVYCKQCAVAACENKETCPICRFPIVKVTEGYVMSSDNTCSLCFENPADSIVTPCGHLGFCNSCLEKWFKTSKSCPICRNEPSTFKTIMVVQD